MAVTKAFKDGKEPIGLGYRKRLWVFWQLILEGYEVEPQRMADALKMDEYLYTPGFSERFKESRTNYMSKFDKSVDHSGCIRESAPSDVFSWVSNDDQRFFSWAFVYWNQVLGYFVPLLDIGYINPKDKMILWMDSISGFRGVKGQLEAQIRDAWYQNKQINKALDYKKSKEKGFWSFFWERTILEFQGSIHYQRALAMNPGFDNPAEDAQCYYSAVLLYDVADIGLTSKLRIINDIKKKWSNNTRQKIQTNIYLLPETREKLEKVADAHGLRKSELVAHWIWESDKDLE
mgnify:CR=1 FL=1